MLLAISLAKVAAGLRLRLPVIPRIKQIFTVIQIGLCQSLLLGKEVVMEVIVGVAVPLKMWVVKEERFFRILSSSNENPTSSSSNAGSGFLLRCHCFCVWEFRRIRHGSCPTTLLTHAETQNRAYRFCCPKRRVSLHHACGRVRGKARFDPHRENRPARRGNMEGCTRRWH